jgi:uncharacterized damage-inducible protein DinB
MPLDEQGRMEPENSGNPIQIVSGFHRFLRDTLIFKASGLTEEQLRWSPVQSGTCLLGLIKHSINVERYWIAEYIAGETVAYEWSDNDANAEWRITSDDSFERLVGDHRAEQARTERILSALTAANLDRIPDTDAASKRGFSIGWVLTHMVEEVGRHCGHADLIREMIDGSVGE